MFPKFLMVKWTSKLQGENSPEGKTYIILNFLCSLLLLLCGPAC